MYDSPSADRIRDVVEQYFARVRVGDTARVVELFAEDAVIDYRDATVVRGTAALRAHFLRTVTNDQPPSVEVTGWIVDSPRCATELVAFYNRGQRERHAIDVFTFDKDARIAHLTV